MLREFAERFPDRDPPSRLTVSSIYNKFVSAGSVADNYKGNAGRPRTGRSEVNIADGEPMVNKLRPFSNLFKSLQRFLNK